MYSVSHNARTRRIRRTPWLAGVRTATCVPLVFRSGGWQRGPARAHKQVRKESERSGIILRELSQEQRFARFGLGEEGKIGPALAPCFFKAPDSPLPLPALASIAYGLASRNRVNLLERVRISCKPCRTIASRADFIPSHGFAWRLTENGAAPLRSGRRPKRGESPHRAPLRKKQRAVTGNFRGGPN